MKNFIQIVLTTIILINSTVTLNAQTNIIKAQGSDTMLPVMTALVNMYSSSEIDVEGGGSSTGFKGLSNYAIQFALSSRKVRSTEKEEIENKYDHLLEKVIAFDALSIVTHPSNPVKKLSLKTLAKIFKGDISNWKQLGGDDLPIIIVTRSEKSGSYSFFKSQVMISSSITENCFVVNSNSSVVQKVSQNKGAIGYCGLAYIDEIVQPISICTSNEEYVYPSFRNALLKKYPLSRPLYLYYRDSEKTIVQRFVKFALSERGQQIIAHKGYIPAF